MVDDWGPIIVGGILAGIVIMIAAHWMLSKNEKTQSPTQEKNTWEMENERWLRKKRIKEYAKTISKNPIKPFRSKPIQLSKKKFEGLPTIQCKSCAQIFHCDWKDPPLVIHEEQELMINKDWKGFEKVGKRS